MLNNNYMYSLSDNCILRIGPHKNVISEFGKDIEETTDMQIDNRMSLISYGSTRDLIEYFRYFYIVSSSARSKLSNEDFMKGNFVAMLDNGFVPFYMAPTYMPKELEEKFKELIKSTGVHYLERKPMRFDGIRIDSLSNDIWISRVEAAKYASVDLAKFNTLEFMKGVWEGAYN